MTIHDAARDALIDIVTRAKREGYQLLPSRHDTTWPKPRNLIDDVRNALDGYCIQRRASIDLSEWRAYLPKLAKAVRALVTVMQDSKTPGKAINNPLSLPHLPIEASIYAALRDAHVINRMLDHADSPSDGPILTSEYSSEWMERIFPFDLPQQLSRIESVVDQLRVGIQTVGRDRNEPDFRLGISLADIWLRHTDSRIVDARDPLDGRQTGDFADFARWALTALNPAIRPDSEDWIIRIGATRSKSQK